MAAKKKGSGLKTTIETELASAGASPAGKEFSRGIIFSRSRGKQVQIEDQQLLEQMKTMDDKTFSKFASRLGTLKNIKEKAPK